MTPNNNLSVLPWYKDINLQNHRKSYAYGNIYPLFVSNKNFIPFQLQSPTSSDPISVVIVDKNGMGIMDITTQLYRAGLHIVPFTSFGYDIIVFNGASDINLNLPEGLYYAKLSRGVDIWYSEVFTIVNDISTYLKIEWEDVDDLVFDDGRIVYNTGFKNVLYLCSEIGKPEYEFEEEGENRDGYFFPEKQISEKTYKFTFLAPEYLCDVLRLVRMSDSVNIYKDGQVYDCDTFLITPKWQTQGDIAVVDAEFQCSTVIKKIGRAYVGAAPEEQTYLMGLSNSLANRENLIEVYGEDFIGEIELFDKTYAYYLLEKNPTDSLENFEKGTIHGETIFERSGTQSFLKLISNAYFTTNGYDAKSLVGNTGTGNYTVGLCILFNTLQSYDVWIWQAKGSNSALTGLYLRASDKKYVFRRVTSSGTVADVDSNTVAVPGKVNRIYCRYNWAANGKMEIWVNGILENFTNFQQPCLFNATDSDLIYLGSTRDASSFAPMKVAKFRVASVLLLDADIKNLSKFKQYYINMMDMASQAVYTVDDSWVLQFENKIISFTLPPDWSLGQYWLYLTDSDGRRSNKFPFSVIDLAMETGFIEDFTNPAAFKRRFQALHRQWGGKNGGVVEDNVYIGYDGSDKVLVLEAHGDNYTGSIQGADRFGNPAFDEFGNPITKRVGGVLVSRNYMGFGSIEILAKPIDQLGVASAFWNFHYQEVYEGDPRWEKYSGDYVRTGELQRGLKSQFNTFQHQNANTSGTDNSSVFLSDLANTTFTTGLKGDPSGNCIKYAGSIGYAIDFLNASVVNPLEDNFALSFWVKINAPPPTLNRRHNIISQGNAANSFGVQAFYQTPDHFEMQGIIRTSSDTLAFIGPNVVCNYGEWYHVCMTGNQTDTGNEISYFINGNKIDNSAKPAGIFWTQTWWRALQNIAMSGPAAGTVAKNMELSDVRIFNDYLTELEVSVLYGRPYFVGKLDFSYLGLHVSGDTEVGFYIVRNNEIDIEIPSHLLPHGDIESPSLLNAKFNTWRGELQNWNVGNWHNFEYWEEYRNNYRPMGIDITDGLYHKFRYDWYHDRVDFYIDDVLIISNKNFMEGINSYNIPETVTKFKVGLWFPSGSIKWAGPNANFDVLKMFVKQIKYTPFPEENINFLKKVGETYPTIGVKNLR